MNISEHVDSFIQEMKRLGLSNNTINSYSNCVKIFFEISKKDHPKNINENDIKEFLSNYDESNTQRNFHSAIKKFYSICLKQNNKFKYIPYCKKSNKLPIVLSQDEVEKMFNVCKNKKHKAILAVLYSCGLRVSELINLKWEHIDRSRMIINIIQSKGNKDRQVMLDYQLIKILEEYWREYKSKEYVFNGQNGNLQYSKHSVLQVIKKLAYDAKIKKRVWTHLMRHNSFTHLVESGTDINLVQRLAGHSSVKTTSIYLHLSHTTISKIKSPLSQINLVD
jgi:site-specific recombinase XerD